MDRIELMDVHGRVDLLLIAAECSGDELGAGLIADYRQLHQNAVICAVGGIQMAAEADHFLHNMVSRSVMGIVEVLRHWRFFYNFIQKIVAWVEKHRPKCICFIDSPSLNLRIARELVERGIGKKGGGPIPLCYYVAPQIWAWKPRRRFVMAKYIDALAVLFPFEAESFADTSLPVTYTGHPLLRTARAGLVHYEKNGKILLLPGSRKTVVRRLFPTMLAAAADGALSDVREFLCLYPTEDIRQILHAELVNAPNVAEKIKLISIAEANQCSVGAQAVIVNAGTMSLRCALEGIPGVIIYRTHPATYWIGKKLVKTPYLGIASILLGYEFYPEYLQNGAQPKILAEQVARFLRARKEFATIAEELRRILTHPGETTAQWLRTCFLDLSDNSD
ncbi:MAG: lipid-A-disaccharide synthase [Puniceicoccales bacterium]|nr:lipid-A-disaccharide synthase [Puniceicoccales bacterium]